MGVGTIREAMVDLDEFLAYRDTAEEGMLMMRVRPLLRVGGEVPVDEAVALVRCLAPEVGSVMTGCGSGA